MSSWVNKLKQITQRDKDLFAGYIKNVTSNQMNIPYAINQLCLLFYVIFEKWDKNCKGDWIKINDIGTICKCIDETNDKYQRVLGSEICKKSTNERLLKHHGH